MLSVYQVGTVLLLFLGLAQHLRPIALLRVWHRDSLLVPLGWLFLWGCLSLLWAHNYYEAGMKLLLWGTALLFATLVVAWQARAQQLQLLLTAVFGAGAMLALYGILQVVYDIRWPASITVPNHLFLNNNEAAEYLLLSWPLGLVLLARGGLPRYLSLITWGALFLYFIYILLSQSLGSQLAWLVQLIFVSTVWWRQGWRRLVAVRAATRYSGRLVIGLPLLALGMMLILFPEWLHTLLSIPERIAMEVLEKWRLVAGGSGEVPYRLYPWINTLPMIQDHALLGVGIGNWTVFYPAYQGVIWQDPMQLIRSFHQNVHNDYLEILAELGVVGVVLVSWATLRIMRVWWQLRGSANGLLILVPIGIAACALISFPLMLSGSLMLLLLALALLERARAPRQLVNTVAEARDLGVWHWCAIGTVALCLLAISVFHYRLYQSEVYSLQAQSAHAARDFTTSKVAGQLLQEWLPWRQRKIIYQAPAMMQAKQYKLLLHRYERALASYPYDARMLKAVAELHLQGGLPAQAMDYLLREGQQWRHARHNHEGDGALRLEGLQLEWSSQPLIEHGVIVQQPGQSPVAQLADNQYFSYHPLVITNQQSFTWSVNMARALMAMGEYEIALQHLHFARQSYWWWQLGDDIDSETYIHYFRSGIHREGNPHLNIAADLRQWRQVDALIDQLSAEETKDNIEPLTANSVGSDAVGERSE